MHTFKTGLVLLIALSIAACVERKERIKVAADGTVHAAARFKADSREELYEGRVPSPSIGWAVTESMDEDKAAIVAQADADLALELDLEIEAAELHLAELQEQKADQDAEYVRR